MPNPLHFKLRLEALEDRRMLSASSASTAPPQTAYENLVQASVVGENVFYNDSFYDGYNPAANAADDGAIATDKTALQPGQTATAANYTTFSQGINGIMVDIAGLPSNVTASDFAFAVGNSSDPSTWTQLTVAPTVTVRWGAGADGSARVELTWANNVIQNEWLQVTVLADADTGLSTNDVFYYGNSIGSGSSGLNLISAPATVAQTPFATEQPDFMHALGDNEFFFAPLIVETNDGTLISVAEAESEGNDAAGQGIAETVSTNGGQTWSPITMIYTAPNFPTNAVGLGSMVVDQKTGAVFLMFNYNDTSEYLMSTTNDGQTWSTATDVSSSVKGPGWGWIAAGPGNGIQLTTGPDAGRLVIPVDYRFTSTSGTPAYDAVVYSDNDGATWQVGGGPDPSVSSNAGVNEASIVQLSSGAIYMNSRLEYATNTTPERAYSISYDGGMTWSNVVYNNQLNTPSVEGSMIRLDPSTLLFAAPDDPNNTGVRQQMTIWASFDDGQNWTIERVISYDFAGYSDMVALGDDSAMLVFNAGQQPGPQASYEKVDLVKFNLAALESGQTPQFSWNFDELPLGQAAPIGGSSIRDDGLWDERGIVQSTGGIPYYVPGSNGDEALRIVNGSNVVLSPATTDGLQFGAGQSFTFQFELRTTSANGVLLGEMPGAQGYTFSLVNGVITFNVNDGKNSVTLSGTTIDDGNWHSVVGVRNAATQTLSLYVDGTLVATGQDTTGSLQNSYGVTLGSYADGSSQLTLDIDLVQATRAALAPAQFLTSSYVPPQSLPVPTTTANNVLNLPGLSFYLPPYDDRNYFADLNDSDPLLVQPVQGTAARSAIDATGNYVVQGSSGGTVHYEPTSSAGAYWSSQTGVGWTVPKSNGTQSPAQNFDFVQNTETFTISEVFNVPSVPNDGDLVLVGNNNGTTALPGFDLTVDDSGKLDFNITDGTGSGTPLLSQSLATFAAGSSSLPQLSTAGWYQIVIVGNGAGTPLQYYLTPMTATEVQQYQGSKSMTPIATPTATGATQNLQIANVSDGLTPTGVPTVNFKDLAIFNQALTPAEVEQSLLDEANPPAVTASGTINTFTYGGTAVAVDSGVTVSSQDADLTGATVTIGNDQPGDALNYVNQNGITGSYSGGVLSLSGIATPAQYQMALQSVTFSTTSISTTSRAISTVAFDGGLTSSAATEQVDVAVVPIRLTPSGVTNTFTVGGAATALDSGLTVISYESDLSGATVTISPSTFEPGDVLNFVNQSGISGSYSAGTLTLSGNATPAQYQAALQSVTFSTTSTTTSTRAISVVALDNSLTSNMAAESVSTGVDFVIPSGSVAGYTIGAPAVSVDSGVKVSSFDTDLSGATVTISAGTLQPGDTLSFVSPVGSGITGSYSGGALTLSGSAPVAQYQAALQSVAFSSNNPGTGTTARAISIITLDGALTSNTALEQVNVFAPITVVGAYVSGTSWMDTGTSTNFDAYLARHGLGSVAIPSLGFALQTGNAQLTALPWTNINTISVQFSGAVSNIGLGSLELLGGTGGGAVAAPAVTGFTNDGNNAYSWTFASSLGNNKYVFAIATTGSSFGTPGSTQVVDPNGDGISGAFTTGSSTLPSGNGLAGSTFDFFFNVLPGDGNQTGTVTSASMAGTKALSNDRETSSAYSPYYDYNGAGIITGTDAIISSTDMNTKQSDITWPTALFVSRQIVATESVGVIPLALAVQETGGSTSLTTGSSTSLTAGGSPAASATQMITATSTGNLASPAAASTAGTSGTAGTSSDGPASSSASTSSPRTGHGRHYFAATDAAVAAFALADLYL